MPMSSNQLDENAVDLRTIESQPLPITETVGALNPEVTAKRTVSAIEIFLVAGIMLGCVALVYLLLSKNSSNSSAERPPVLSPATRPSPVKPNR